MCLISIYQMNLNLVLASFRSIVLGRTVNKTNMAAPREGFFLQKATQGESQM